MRSLIPSFGIFTASMLATSLVIAASAPPAHSSSTNVRTVIGLQNTAYFNAASNGRFYVQAGTFKSAIGAEKYKRALAKKYRQPVKVQPQGKYHVVVIGPMNTAAEVRALGESAKIPATRAQPVKSGFMRDKYGLLEPVESPDRFEIIGALGVASLRAGNSLLGVTRSETDTLVQTNRNQWNSFAAQLGVGYLHYFGNALRYSDQTQWFPSIEPQVNIHYIDKNKTIKGDVWRFQSPAFNQLTFEAPVRSTRLMFDTALTVMSRKQFSLYIIGGIGNAWNRMAYKDRDNQPRDPCANETLNLQANTRSNFAWEAGGGLMYTINDRMALTLQYLYADIGKASSSSNGTSGTITVPVIVAPRFDLNAQTASIGLHFAL